MFPMFAPASSKGVLIILRWADIILVFSTQEVNMDISSSDVIRNVVAHLTKLQKRRPGGVIRFPINKKLRKSPEEHFNVIIDQANKIIDERSDRLLCGMRFWSEDKEALERLFANDLQQFLAAEQISVPGVPATYAQTLIPDKASFNIARSRVLPNTYESIELANHVVAFETFSIPFLVRLSIENKLKKIIGFVKCDISRPGLPPKLDTQDLPVSSIIQELKRLKCLELPCDFDDLLQIYIWSCRFCHTGQKEYLWLNMKAIEILSPLFSFEKHLECQIQIQSLWGYGVLRPEVLFEKLYNHVGPCQPLYYFKKGWGIQSLEHALNTTSTKSLKDYTFYLSESELDERLGFYCQKNKVHI